MSKEILEQCQMTVTEALREAGNNKILTVNFTRAGQV